MSYRIYLADSEEVVHEHSRLSDFPAHQGSQGCPPDGRPNCRLTRWISFQALQPLHIARSSTSLITTVISTSLLTAMPTLPRPNSLRLMVVRAA